MQEELYTNKFGIYIKKCCASCVHAVLDSRMRICQDGEGVVPSSFVCKHWKIKDGLENAGKGGGDVKRKEYLRYALTSLEQEEKLAERNKHHRRKTVAEVRKEYSERYGEIIHL